MNVLNSVKNQVAPACRGKLAPEVKRVTTRPWAQAGEEAKEFISEIGGTTSKALGLAGAQAGTLAERVKQRRHAIIGQNIDQILLDPLRSYAKLNLTLLAII